MVCKKNVAHRRMTSRIEKSRLLILGGALEYQRVSNHLSSFDTLLQQVVTFYFQSLVINDCQCLYIICTEYAFICFFSPMSCSNLI